MGSQAEPSGHAMSAASCEERRMRGRGPDDNDNPEKGSDPAGGLAFNQA